MIIFGAVGALINYTGDLRAFLIVEEKKIRAIPSIKKLIQELDSFLKDNRSFIDDKEIEAINTISNSYKFILSMLQSPITKSGSRGVLESINTELSTIYAAINTLIQQIHDTPVIDVDIPEHLQSTIVQKLITYPSVIFQQYRIKKIAMLVQAVSKEVNRVTSSAH